MYYIVKKKKRKRKPGAVIVDPPSIRERAKSTDILPLGIVPLKCCLFVVEYN